VPIDIRTVPQADLYKWARSVGHANSEEIPEQDFRDIEPEVEPDRTFGAYDGDQVIGGGSIFSFDLTVPGGAAVPVAGITWIGIMPTHRRQGALRQLMTRMIEDATARHEPLAVLWASEGSIYQRFGYGLATRSGAIDMERDRALFNSAVEPWGRTRLIDIDEARRLFPPIFEVSRARIPGFYSRSQTWWDIDVLADFKWARRGFDRKFYAVHESDEGVPDAYAMYRVRQEWANSVPGSELGIQEIFAVDGDALREMWRFILGVDLIKRITARGSSPDEPLLQMVMEPRRVNLAVRDGLWLRVIDVVDALQRRTYSADGTVERTDDAADIALAAADLGALYLGDQTFTTLARAGRTKELSTGARARADEMLRTDVRPWCPQIF
jgi:predicted acetyltransferase